jgi:hypothetical protein
MKKLGKILRSILGSTTEGPCPLCGAAEFYATSGTVRASQLVGKINEIAAWADAHLSPGNLPDMAPTLRAALGDPQLPDLAKNEKANAGDDGEHVRCSRCDSLIPPQFWRVGPARRLALTVAGAPAHGKTTWILAVLKPPPRSRYAIIGFTDSLIPRPYLYSEPYTLTMLEKGLDARFRSFVPLLLMGSTVRHGREDVDIRTLDIMGEMFGNDDHLPNVSRRIKQHITSRRGGGALFVVQRFSKDQAEQNAATQIAGSYANIIGELSARNRSPVLWRGVVWTFLDEAQWSPEMDVWLQSHVNSGALFSAIGATLPSFQGDDAPFAAYRQIRDEHNAPLELLLRMLTDKEISVAELPLAILEGLIALLFRLQVVYSLDAARHARNRYADYYQHGGKEYVGLVQELARALYLRWDSQLGGVGGFVMNNEDPDRAWRVMPCGRLVEDGISESVWNDQLLLDTLRWVRSI